MGRRPKTIFALHNGVLYVRSKYCGIPMLIILTDGFTLHGFRGEKDLYLKAVHCLEWFKRELEFGESHGYKKTELDAYRQNIDSYNKAIADLVSVDASCT